MLHFKNFPKKLSILIRKKEKKKKSIERVGRTEQHMVESLKVVEEKLWTDLAIYCHVC